MFDLVKLLIFVPFGYGFNVDVEKAIVYTGTPGSYYGATTEMLTNLEGNWVLVGAPRQNYSGIIKPGAVYRCPVSTSSTTTPACLMLPIRAAQSPYPANIQSEENQGLGLNMLITNNYLVACSPSWKQTVTIDTYYAYGKCSDVPFGSMNTNYNKFFAVPSGLLQTGSKIFYMVAEFGFSSAIRSGFGANGIVMGTPVVYDSTGGFIYYRESNVANFWDRFNVLEHGSTDSLTTVFRSGAYLGYSIGAGVFGPTVRESPSSYPIVVMGAPGFSNNDGTVGAMGIFERISSSALKMQKMIAGKVIGSGFGQSLIVADFNNDNKDDIAVGAPMEGEDEMNKVDVGAVYIYYGTLGSDFIDASAQRLRGSGAILARFGHSIACPGDLNKDGFKDLIVGAPYEQDNKGAIYIFNGGAPRMETMYSQRILAADINSDLRGFGFSLSKNTIDVDSNTYTDTSVGSLLSSHAVVFRTRSIVTITSIPILNPTVMPFNSTGLACRGNSDNFNPCTSVEVCFNYTGDGLTNGIYIDYTLTSDPETSDVKERRFTFYQNNVTQGTVYTKTQLFIASGETKCESLHARIAMTDRKFFARVNDDPRFEVTYKISNESAGNEVRPILAKDKASEISNVTGRFLTECTPTCKPDLMITGAALTSLVQVGKTQELEVQILVINIADPAYGASIVFNNSIGAIFSSYAVLLEQGSERMTCAKEGDGARCTFDKNPLFPQVRGLVNVRFDVSSLQLLRGVALQSLPAVAEVFAVAEVAGDVDTSNNVARMNTNLQLEASIEMAGSSSPDQVRISEGGKSRLTLSQAYSIMNTGPSPLPLMKTSFSIPVMYKDKLIIERSQLELSALSPSINCSMISFPSSESVTSSPGVVINPSVIITESNVPLGCGVSGVGCAVFECLITDLEVDFQAIVIQANITEENLPDIPAGTTQIQYYTTGILYPSKKLPIPLNIKPSNVTYSAVLPIFPDNIIPPTAELNLLPLIVGLSVGVLLMVLLAIALWKLGFFRRKKREELNQYKRKSYAHARQSRALTRASRDLDAEDRKILSQYTQMN